MKPINSIKSLFVLVLVTLMLSCSSDSDSGSPVDTFDRQVMLTNWADNIIVPSYQAFRTEVGTMKTAADAFEATPNQANFNTLRTEWEDAYIAWQNVAMFDIGPAETSFLRSFVNTYPTNTSEINTNISSGNYNLQSINLNDAQGFPALDYLLFGLGATDQDILAFYTGPNGSDYLDYLTDVVDRINTLTTTVLTDWQGTYRSTFINNSGSSSNSATNSLVNNWMFYYEVVFRNGKIGFPAGVFSSNMPSPEIVEAFYKKDLSKTLCLEALNAFQDFFRGNHFNSNSNGQSLESYLDFLNSMKNGQDLSALINDQFNVSRNAIQALDISFYNQINTNNNAMLTAFEELQDNVVYLKSDMFSALSIAVEFQSGDGD